MRHIVRQSLYIVAAFVGCVSFGAIVASSSTVGAVTSSPKMFVSADNVFYAYARGGETISASFAKSSQTEPGNLAKHDVTVSLDGPGLAAQTCVLPKNIEVGKGCGFTNVIAPQTGIYRVSFTLPANAEAYREVSPSVKWGGNLFSWSIAVKDGTVEKTGRIWSELYAARQPAPDTFLTDLTYHYISESGYIYRALYKGYNGQISTFSADSVGVRTGKECQSAYQSIEVVDTQRSPSFGTCGGSYKLFFEQPAGDLPQKAKKWDAEQTDWVSPVVSSPKISDLSFSSDKTGDMQSGKIKFKLANFVGQYMVEIDTSGDGSFGSKDDVKIKRTMKKLDTSLQEVQFDGVDTRGQVVPASQQIGIRVHIEKVAEIHLVNADVEGRTGGLELVRLSGENAPSSRMCWNDTDLTPLKNATLQTSKLDGRSCPDSTTDKLHGWAYASGSWGDGRYIDDWAYATSRVEGTSSIRYPESDEPLVASTKSTTGQLAVAIAAIVLLLLFIVLIGIFLVKRRHHKKMLAMAAQQQHMADFRGPGDPRPPEL